MKRMSPPTCLVLACLLLLPTPGGAQAPTSAPRPTLAGALAQAVPPDKGLALAVAADKVTLPPSDAPPAKGATVAQVADAYGRAVRAFGAVTAVAPPTMVVLNADPGQADIFADMPAQDAFTLLAASLTPGQLQALASAQGLGQDDLSNDYQRSLFLAAIPSHTLWVRPRPATDASPPPTDARVEDSDVRDVSGELPQARMRLGQEVGMVMPGKNGIGGLIPKLTAPGAPPVYDFAEGNAGLFNQARVDGVQVRAEVPNTPKPGQLDLTAGAFRAPVPLAGLKTVGDLIKRVGGVTRTELYADRRYEGRALTVVGSPASAPAGDLLGALAFCVTGTFRKVGPAYVLTDDVLGAGTRRRILGEFQDDNAARRAGPLKTAEDELEATKALRSLTLDWFGDPLAAPPEEIAHAEKGVLWAGAFTGVSLPLGQLTPAQQDVVRREADYLDRVRREHPEQGAIEADLNGKVTIMVQPSVQLLVPGLDGPIDTDLGQWIAGLFQDRSRFRPPHHIPTAVTSSAPSVDLAALTASIPRRAVLAHPRTPAEVDALILTMKKLDLNQLWLDVFSQGHAHVPGLPLSDVAESSLTTDILTEALTKTRGTGISVFPSFDLLTWGTKVPGAAADLNILGETSAQSRAAERQRDLLLADADGRDPPGPPDPRLAVSPLNPGVRRTLLGLVHALASRPGVAGLVWRETAPPGYDPRANPMAMAGSRTTLGYAEAARLAFLRQDHADPVDVDTPGGGLAERADTGLPDFDDPAGNGLGGDWNQFRGDADLGLLRALYAAAESGRAPTAPLRVLVQNRRDESGVTWYGSWDGPNAPLPTRHDAFSDFNGQGAYPHDQDEAKQAKAQSRVALVRLPLADKLDAAHVAAHWRGALEDLATNHKWDGFVLDTPAPAEP